MKKKYGDVLSGAVIFLVAMVYFWGTLSIKGRSDTISMGSAFIPRLYAVLISVLALCVIWQGVKKIRAEKAAAPNSENSGTQNTEQPQKNRMLLMLIAFGLLVIAVALLQSLGFVPTMTGYLFFSFVTLTPRPKRRYVLFSALAVCISLGIYYIFVKLFSVMLPAGILVGLI